MSRRMYSNHNTGIDPTNMALERVPDRALSVRAPPPSSITSRASRRHRRNRSDAGGYSYQPSNEFPVFSRTGDVEIVIRAGGQEMRYLLHKLYLAQCSGFFETGTSDQWSRGQELGSIGEDEQDDRNEGKLIIPGAQSGKMMWRYELDPGTREDDMPMLVQKNAREPLGTNSIFGGENKSQVTRSKSNNPSNGFFRSVAANFSAINLSHSQPQDDPEDDTIRDYDNLFRIFYNFSPNLDPVNIANAYVQCKSLLALADMYDALEVVGPRVDHHLLRFQGRLWKQIAKYPSSYLKLGYMARSKAMFSEALVHVVGQWPTGATYLRSQLPESVMDIIEDKVEELEDSKMKVEARLFRLTLVTSKGERVTPSNSYMDWIAVSLFRQWLAENTTPPPIPTQKNSPRVGDQRALPPNPPPINTGQIYRLLGQGGSSYLSHDECKRFLRLRPDDFSRDQLRRFERKIDEIKALVKEIVRPLMRNSLELDLGRDGGSLGYLTCTRIDERDYPWDE